MERASEPTVYYNLVVDTLSFIYQLASTALNTNNVITVRLDNTRNLNQRNESHSFASLDNIISREHLRCASRNATS